MVLGFTGSLCSYSEEQDVSANLRGAEEASAISFRLRGSDGDAAKRSVSFSHKYFSALSDLGIVTGPMSFSLEIFWRKYASLKKQTES